MTAILDAIFNFSKRSMMPEWHQLDSSCTMSEQQESMKKKTLKSSSRSFLFSTGLPCLADEIAEPRPDMNIKDTAFTESLKGLVKLQKHF